MRTTFGQLALAGLVSSTLAYPNVRNTLAAQQNAKRQLPSTTFNAADQYVSTTGVHQFVAPGPGDLRGPCPALNALANHGYLPHNGVGTTQQFLDAMLNVYGMGADLAGILSNFGSVVVGDLFSFSIGGPPAFWQTQGVPLLSRPLGLDYSHNKYEVDVSPGRGDLYITGNDYKLIMSQFQELYDMQKGVAQPNYNMDVLFEYHSRRYDYSKANNPYFVYSPQGAIISSAAFYFTYRMMSNHSAANPEGQLDQNVLKTFFGVFGPDNALYHKPGWERIPDNWYRRPSDNPYTFEFLNFDTVEGITRYPNLAGIGGNTGTAGNFVGVTPENITNGVLTGASLLQGNNFACFAFNFATQIEPDLLKGIFSDLAPAQAILEGAFTNATAGKNCPPIQNFDATAFNQFPGWTQLNNNDGQYTG